MLELITLAAATLISEDAACVAAGLLIASGRHSFGAATLACIAGIYSGDLLYYSLGRVVGVSVIARASRKWETQVRRAMDWFQTHGTTAVFTARFLPGTRVPAYVAAGALGMSFVRFSTFFLIAAFVWTPILVGSSVFLGTSLRTFGWKIQVAAALAMLIAMRTITLVRDERSRRTYRVRWWRMKRKLGMRRLRLRAAPQES